MDLKMKELMSQGRELYKYFFEIFQYTTNDNKQGISCVSKIFKNEIKLDENFAWKIFGGFQGFEELKKTIEILLSSSINKKEPLELFLTNLNESSENEYLVVNFETVQKLYAVTEDTTKQTILGRKIISVPDEGLFVDKIIVIQPNKFVIEKNEEIIESEQEFKFKTTLNYKEIEPFGVKVVDISSLQ